MCNIAFLSDNTPALRFPFSVTDEWSVLCPGTSNGPARRKGAVLVAYKESSLFLFGGAGPGVIMNDLWEFNLRENRWIDRSRQFVMSLLDHLPQQVSYLDS